MFLGAIFEKIHVGHVWCRGHAANKWNCERSFWIESIVYWNSKHRKNANDRRKTFFLGVFFLFSFLQASEALRNFSSHFLSSILLCIGTRSLESIFTIICYLGVVNFFWSHWGEENYIFKCNLCHHSHCNLFYLAERRNN